MRKPRITITVKRDFAEIFFAAARPGEEVQIISLPPDVWDHYKRAREFYIDALKTLHANMH